MGIPEEGRRAAKGVMVAAAAAAVAAAGGRTGMRNMRVRLWGCLRRISRVVRSGFSDVIANRGLMAEAILRRIRHECKGVFGWVMRVRAG